MAGFSIAREAGHERVEPAVADYIIFLEAELIEPGAYICTGDGVFAVGVSWGLTDENGALHIFSSAGMFPMSFHLGMKNFCRRLEPRFMERAISKITARTLRLSISGGIEC